LLAFFSFMAFTPSAWAQGGVLILCQNDAPCEFRRAAVVSIQGKNNVRLASPDLANNDAMLRRTSTTRIEGMIGIYREPDSGMVRTISADGTVP
jgi:hypothetical protein